MKTRYLGIVCLLVPAACGSEADDPEQVLSRPSENMTQEESDLRGGMILDDVARERSGIFFLSVLCTATVVSTSARLHETWLITAAHCFDAMPPTVHLYQNGMGSLVSPEPATQVEVFDQFDHHLGYYDIALVKFPFGVKIRTPSGGYMAEYFRPLRDALVPDDCAVFALGAQQDNQTCGTGQPYANDGSFRWGRGVCIGPITSPNGDTGYVRTNSLHPDNTFLMAGDSGAPFLVSFAAEGSTSEHYLDHGVILGVTSGHSCTLGDDKHVSSAVFDDLNRDFIETHMGAKARYVASTYSRTCWDDWCEYPADFKAAIFASTLFQ